MTSGAAGLGREASVLLTCVGMLPPPLRNERLGSLCEDGLDWDQVVSLALTNRVVPLVAGALRGAGVALPQGKSRDRLEEFERYYRMRALEAQRVLGELASLCAGKGIEVVPYKGPALAAALYEDAGQRQFNDLDLLVGRLDVEPVVDLLTAQGFTVLGDLWQKGRSRHIDRDCELELAHPRFDLRVELHWQALPARYRRGFDVDDMRRRLVDIQLAGRRFPYFATEDLLLLLCVHGGEKHRWMRLQMLADLARLLSRNLDWNAALERAREIGRLHTVLLGSYLAWLLLDARMPSEVLALATQDRRLQGFAAIVRGRLFRSESGLPAYKEWRAYLEDHRQRAEERGLPRASDLGFGTYLLTVATPEWSDRQSFALPRGLDFLYFVVRPMRLLKEHGLGLVRRI